MENSDISTEMYKVSLNLTEDEINTLILSLNNTQTDFERKFGIPDPILSSLIYKVNKETLG